MITNIIKTIEKDTISVPIITKSKNGDWVPSFELWETKIDTDTSYIDCSQNFRAKLKDYDVTYLESMIGLIEDEILIIHWKALINSEDVNLINQTYSGKLRATSWQRRYCTYFSTSSNMPWLHTTLMQYNDSDYVVHHIDGVSVDNRKKNLHLLPKREHDSINHAGLEERKKMFLDPKQYWIDRKKEAVDILAGQLASIITTEGQIDFIENFALENKRLAKEVLEKAKVHINLSCIKETPSKNRIINSHLREEYLDTYEIEKYLKIYEPKISEKQLKLF